MFVLTVVESGVLTVAVDDVPGDGVDVDVHLLNAADPAACVARHNTSIQFAVAPGEWFVAVDTWVNAAGAAFPGPFTLSVSWDQPPMDCSVNPISCTSGDYPLVNAVVAEPVGVGGCPAGMVPVEAFCIDRYEAHLVEVGGPQEVPWSPYENSGAASVRAKSAAGVVPQAYVSQLQAGAACQAAGKRLCTNTEWLRACQGSTGWTYPYGPSLQPGVCNDARECHPAIQYFETSADWIWSELQNGCIGQLPDGLASTGAHPGCQSPDGPFDMMGNLHEWTSDPAGTFRGGFYVDTAINGAGCTYKTTAHNVSYWDYSTGFRCCADP